MNKGQSLAQVRTIVFTTLLLCNIMLTFVNRSFTENFTKTIRYKNNLALPVFIISLSFLLIIQLLTSVRNIFGLAMITKDDFFLCLAVAFIAVVWFEIYKTLRRSKSKDVPALSLQVN